MANFSFAGELSTTHHVKLLRSPISVLPGTRDKVITLPGRAGALRITPDLGERFLSLECWVESANIVQLRQRLVQIAAWLNPLRGAQQLIFDDMPDRYQLASYYGGGLDADINARQGFFTLRLVCADPFIYALVPEIVIITTSPHVHTQTGTAPANPLFKLQGISTSAGGQQISITVDAQTTTFQGALAAGDWLEIDSEAKTVFRVVGTTRTSVLRYMQAPIFPELVSGANTITVTTAGGASWMQLEIDCRNRWL
ncbi:MAG: distal tail protein Dit [Alkaliphilus sp.]